MEKTLEEDSTSKFVIFTNFSDAINLLAAVFKDRAIQTVQISGQTSKAARQKATTAFAKDPNVKVRDAHNRPFRLTLIRAGLTPFMTPLNVVMCTGLPSYHRFRRRGSDADGGQRAVHA
jgi:ERCC4-related helicase